MTTAPCCPECGDTGRLNRSGVCAWRSGCEHRRMVSDARMAELDRFLAPVVAVAVPWAPVDLDVEHLVEIAVRHVEAATAEAHERGLLPDDCAFVVPEITFDDGP